MKKELPRKTPICSSIDFVLLGECVDVSDTASLKRLITIFLEQIPEGIGLIQGAIGRRERTPVENLAHQLKGSSMSIGAVPLSRLFKVVETAGHDGNFDFAEKALIQAQTEYRSAKEALLSMPEIRSTL